MNPEEVVPRAPESIYYPSGESVATRDAYGNALKRLYRQFPKIVAVDGEVSNSTRTETFKEGYPNRFFEMYIAEQNMAGVALGLQCRGKIPFASSFAAFLTRAFDQVRMSQYSDANIKFIGSHAGTSIGEDGPSQMGLEDIAMFRTIHNGVVLYPSDAVSAEKIVELAALYKGIAYIRTTRMKTPILYDNDEQFTIGGSKILKKSAKDAATVIGAGVTLHEALKAYDALKKEGILIRVIDLYSIKPIDEKTLQQAAKETSCIITVEDHYPEGGIGEAVSSGLGTVLGPLYSLAVRKKPKSGKPQELLDFEEISKDAIIKKVKENL
jgi:transketolase